MSTSTTMNAPHTSVGITGAPVSTRVLSIDIFRGLNIALMIFVNELASVRGLPWWTYHAKTQWDVMTYVDMVFPGFLFIVGMSLPLAINQRLKKGASQLALWSHVFIRSASLVILGLILANGGKANSALMHGLSRRWWELIGVLGCSFFLSVYPTNGKYVRHHKVLQIIGVAMVIFCYAIFRRTVRGTGETAWIDGSYPEILGLIGYAYFAICLLYIPTRRWLWAPVAWLIALVGFNAACAAKWITFPHHLRGYIWPWENGSSASMVMAGVVMAVIYMETRWSLSKKVYVALAYAAATGIAGKLLQPLGISKNRGTPTWCLWTMAACILIFALLYWICDVKKYTKWTYPFRAAGSNTLTTYLLPDYWELILSVCGVTYFNGHLREGWPGILKTVIFTMLMLAIATIITKRKIRLQL
jgi:heparan-alpha-glucosaminide N-acetyltransferase